ncbi:MAG: HNH endonuclease, partial [Kiritimatiellae bacterium]|nr:HNH endonuclease [Kiritimatiellia bacterium]
KGICPLCGGRFELDGMEADHITPWRDGGRTIAANCQMLCRDCNRRKGAK